MAYMKKMKEKKKKASPDDEILEEARKRFELAYDESKDNRERFTEDTLFCTTGDQWPQDVKTARGNRPALTFNKLQAIVCQMSGSYRQNQNAIKVSAAGEDAHEEVAEIYAGLIRNIEYQSKATVAYTTAFECAVRGGFGAWRVTTEYTNDDAFEQDIRIERIRNPLTVYFDPRAQKLDRSDARWCFVTEIMDREDFEELYPDASPDNFDSNSDDIYKEWYNKDGIRVAEYWVKKPSTKKIVQLSDGSVYDMSDDDHKTAVEALTKAVPPQAKPAGEEDEPAPQPLTIVKEREVEVQEVYFYKVCGHAVLECSKWPGKFIPIIPIMGYEVDRQGKNEIYSAIHYAKDAQRTYNYMKTTAVEMVALAPKTPYLVTPEMIQNFEGQWQKANNTNQPYLLYNPTPQGAPQRTPSANMPVAEVNMAMGAADDIKATTGLYDASLGAQGNETSGKAILARQNQGEQATFTFTDNMRHAIAYTGEILIDLIPRIYDTERVIRVMGLDDESDLVPINKAIIDPQTGQEVILNDLTQGKYDVIVTTGPSYASQRMAAVDSIMQFMQVNPQIGPLIMDLVAKNMDWPGSEEIAERLKKALPPGLADDNDGQPQQQGPNPQQQAQMQQAIAMQQQQALEAQQQQNANQIEAAKVQVEAQKVQADIAKIELEHKKLELEAAKIHVALQSGGMNSNPYIP
jgi:hypothetical protein